MTLLRDRMFSKHHTGDEMSTMYHGTLRDFAGHVGLCLTDSSERARSYANGGNIAKLDIRMAGLRVVEVECYDRDSDVAPGDDGDIRDADVIVYDDEDRHGQPHRTWRLMSAAAIAAVDVSSVLPVEWLDAADECGVYDDVAGWVAGWVAADADPMDALDYDGDLATYLNEAA